MFLYRLSTRHKIKAAVSVVPVVVVLDVLVAVADLPGGGVGEVGPGVAVEYLVLELGLGLLQPDDVVMKLSQLGVQRPLLWGEFNLGIRDNDQRGTKIQGDRIDYDSVTELL